MSIKYDFIVVGAGNAGAVIASRLSECPDVSVLVLEAGQDHHENPALHVITGGAALWPDREINWAFETVPQAAYADRCVSHPRGKGLGGSTLVNLGMMTFPDSTSIDAWEALGNPGWSYEQLQPYLRKFHTFHEPSPEEASSLGLDYSDPSLHGKDGPISISYGSYRSDFQRAWVDAFESVGYKATEDALSGRLQGGHNTPGTFIPSRASRSYAGAYLSETVRKRPNLHVVTGAFVEKILTTDNDGGPRRASGVQYKTKDGKVQVVSPKREVLLCAGVFKSPHILELSGIGKSSTLESHGITPLIDLPGVGENLQDHAAVAVSFESSAPTFDSFRDPSVLGAVLEEYKTARSGPMTNAVYCASFMPVMDLAEGRGQEFVERLGSHLDGAVTGGLRKQLDIVRKITEDAKLSSVQYLFSPVQLRPDQTSSEVPSEARAADYYTVWCSMSHPFSRGSVHLTSDDPADHPAIDPRYFSHPADVEVAARHLAWLHTLTRLPAFARLLKPAGRTIPLDLDLSSLDYTRDLVRSGFTTYHPCGTCAMLPREDGGVVDPDLKVYGVEGLRVIDASVFPLIPRGNIQSCVYALAEKAADMIKHQYSLTSG